MPTRRYTIKETKNPAMFMSLFEVSKGAVQASNLGLRPKKPDFAYIETTMREKPGTTVAYELAYDGTELRFEVSVGGRPQEPLARVAPRKSMSGLARLELMRQLATYRLATTEDLKSAEAAVTVEAKAHELRSAMTAVTTFRRELEAMKSETRIRDLSTASRTRFRAWAGRAGLGGPIMLLDFIDKGGWSAGMFDAKTIAYLELAPASRRTVAELEGGGTPDLGALQAEVLKKLDAKMLRGYHADRVARELKPGLAAAVASVKRLETEIKELRKLAAR